MKEELLKNMIHIVDDMVKSYKTDFYSFDLHTIVKDDLKSFVWFVRPSGTYLIAAEKQWYKNNMQREHERFAFMSAKPSERLNISFSMNEFAKEGVTTFLVIDEEIKTVSEISEIKSILEDINTCVEEHIKTYYSDEMSFYGKHIPIKFTSDEVREKVLEILRTDEGELLLQTLKGFRNYRRSAKNECILIGADFAEKSFTFGQIMNDVCVFNGGIIYYNGKWNIHT